MRHRMDHSTLGRYGSHRKAMLSNLAAGLFIHGRISTTFMRAKEVQRVAEKLITRARGGSLHDRRLVISKMPYKAAVLKLFDEIAPRYAGRPGGYTRIIKTGFRMGDASPTAILELVE
ncbi:50S ribosomal protein L17 [Aminiphilus circumscriptus]|jgi:large subunit ribosomal protein L17|uniref:50S ribosomal protein L17 n=1 Tax=Aminiphilus circumscriptus TaxID=290732 RepID=UPI000492D99E|nr:50S ribosomal protein L17 [Aminiphilus circumscriptus]